MDTRVPLPDLDRLISLCQRHSLALKLNPPIASAPKPGESVFGEPFDPQLAAVYQRFGGADFGPISLYRPDSGPQGLIPWNQELREPDFIHFRASHVFARKTGFALYLATVPRLADVHGVQPVIYITFMAELSAVPVASSVARLFDTYSRYLELMVADPEYLHGGPPSVVFPWSVQHLIAQDEPLMAQVRAGQFDFLTREDEAAHLWAQELRATRP